MGNTYGNVTLRGVDVDRVAEVLAGFERSAFLLAEGDRVAVFMPEADEDPLDVAGNLSVALGGPALGAFVFDSDLLVTWLVVDGEIVDRYVSDAAMVAEVSGEDDEGDDDAGAAPDGPRTVVYFVGPGGHGVIAAAPAAVVLPAVEAAGFGQDPHVQPTADTFFVTGEPDDPHDLARRLSAQLQASVIVWSAAAGHVGEYRSGTEVPGSRVDVAAPPATAAAPGDGEPEPGDDDADGDLDGDADEDADGDLDGDDEPQRRPDGGDAAALCAAFGGDPEAVERLLRGTTPVDDPVFHAESLHAALAAALGLPAATVGYGFGHLDEGIELDPDDQARLVRVG